MPSLDRQLEPRSTKRRSEVFRRQRSSHADTSRREPQVTSDDMPVGLPCQRKRTQPRDRMRQRVSRSFHRRLGHQASRNTRRLLTMFKSRITAVRTKCRNQAITLKCPAQRHDECNGDLKTIMWAAPSSQRYNRVYAVGVDYV